MIKLIGKAALTSIECTCLTFELILCANTDFYTIIHQTIRSYLMAQAVFVASVAVRHHVTTPTESVLRVYYRKKFLNKNWDRLVLVSWLAVGCVQ